MHTDTLVKTENLHIVIYMPTLYKKILKSFTYMFQNYLQEI